MPVRLVKYRQGCVRTVVVLVWGGLFLATLAAVVIFVLIHDHGTQTKSYLDLQADVSNVAESSKEVAAAGKDVSGARHLVTELSNLARQADPKKGDEIKQNVAKIAQALNQELDGVQSGWDGRAKGLKDAADKLQKDAGALGTALTSLEREGVHWKAGLLSTMLWVMLLACLLIGLFFSPDVFAMLGFVTRFMKGFKGLGFELSFAGEGGKQRNKEIHAQFKEAFAGLRHQATRELDLFVDHRQVDDYLKNAREDILDLIEARAGGAHPQPLVMGATPPLGGQEGQKAREQIRCTLHVPDLIFRDYLCQLLPYQGKWSASGPAGRAWPVCYGMIGRVWRSKKSELRSLPDLLALAEMEQRLISDYAMTPEQVNHLHNRARSFLCLMLRHDDLDVGVLYMDARPSGVFGDSGAGNDAHSAIREGPPVLFNDLLNLPAVKVLAKELVKYREDLLGKAPRIEVMEA